MNTECTSLRFALAAIGFSVSVFHAAAQGPDKNLKNVRGINPELLVGTVCRGTYEVPGSRSDRDHGAFQIEFFEADDLLRVIHSTKLGYVAYRDILTGKAVLDSSGPAPTLQVEGNKMKFLTGLGSKWEVLLKDGGTLTGTVDPRGMPGRQNWEVAEVTGKCKMGPYAIERSK